LHLEKALSLRQELERKTGQIETLTNLIEGNIERGNYQQGAKQLAEVSRLISRSQPNSGVRLLMLPYFLERIPEFLK